MGGVEFRNFEGEGNGRAEFRGLGPELIASGDKQVLRLRRSISSRLGSGRNMAHPAYGGLALFRLTVSCSSLKILPGGSNGSGYSHKRRKHR